MATVPETGAAVSVAPASCTAGPFAGGGALAHPQRAIRRQVRNGMDGKSAARNDKHMRAFIPIHRSPIHAFCAQSTARLHRQPATIPSRSRLHNSSASQEAPDFVVGQQREHVEALGAMLTNL